MAGDTKDRGHLDRPSTRHKVASEKRQSAGTDGRAPWSRTKTAEKGGGTCRSIASINGLMTCCYEVITLYSMLGLDDFLYAHEVASRRNVGSSLHFLLSTC